MAVIALGFDVPRAEIDTLFDFFDRDKGGSSTRPQP